MLILEKEKNRFDCLKEQLEIEKYRYYRYKVPFCLLIIECKSLNCLNLIKKHIRKTDFVLELKNSLYAVIFRYTDIKNGGHKAAENLLFYLEKEVSSNIFGGLTCADDENIESLINRAFFALEKAKTKNFSNVEDDYLF